MGLLNKKLLLQKDTLQIKKVELGGDDYVFVREMTGRERDNFEQSLMKEVRDTKGRRDYQSNLQDFRAKIAVNTICDENGSLILSMSDYEMLSKNMSASKLQRIVDEAQGLNKITDEDREEMTKNSSGGQAANSTSGSAKN
ncbi:MAG: hypothetical protein PVG39_31960 [Desulfobacteraceae bacterium]|jgi:hypothetical protein